MSIILIMSIPLQLFQYTVFQTFLLHVSLLTVVIRYLQADNSIHEYLQYRPT